MNYTVNMVAKMAGVSVRTLHYYDEIGLLRPSFLKENGYRYYGEKELIKLAQILFFRELEFSLGDIQQMMDSESFNQIEALKDQRKLLELKRNRINKLMRTIDTALINLKGGDSMNTDDLLASFGDDELVKNMEEAKTRWGNTDAYKESMQKVKNWTKTDYEKIKKDGEELTKKLALAMDRDIKSTKVQALIEEHHVGVEYFYTCPLDLYRGLADLYASDSRFAAYYNKFRPGLARWVKEAIHYYCDVKERKAKEL